MKADLHSFLSKFDKDYQEVVPNFWKHINIVSLFEGHNLSNNLGDIFLVSSGYLVKYCEGKPERYIGAGELIIVPLSSHMNYYKSLTNSKVYQLKRKRLYSIIKKSPESVILFDKIREVHSHQLHFRYRVLKLPKKKRVEYFRENYNIILNLISRKELADYLDISTEYLRRSF